MNFLHRRKAFVLVQEHPKLENTKKILSSKLEFLTKQTKFAFEVISKNDLLVPDYVNNCLFSLDLQSKIAASLLHLSNTSNVEWCFLNTLKVKDIRPYLIGEIDEATFLLDTDLICRDSNTYFFNLAKLGIIDSKSWVYLSKLKNYSESVGSNYLNDSSYYAYKNTDVIKPLEAFNEFDELEVDFLKFIGKPLVFKNLQPVLFNFLKITDESKNANKIFTIANWKNPQYENIRTNKSLLRIPLKQREALIEALSQLNSFPKLYQAAMEIQIFSRERPVLISTFKYFLQFFLYQGGYLFDVNNPDYENRTLLEKFSRAIMWIDFLIFLCENSISITEINSDSVTRNNFESACKIELSVLLDKKAMNDMFLFNLLNTAFLMEKIEKLKGMSSYKSGYSNFVNRYISINL